MKLENLKKNFTLLTILVGLLVTIHIGCSIFGWIGTQENEVNPPDMTIRLELFTSNIHKTVHFYKNVLGFKSLNSSNPGYHPIQKGQVVLGIGLLESLENNHYFSPSQSDSKFGYGVEIVLEVEDVQFLYDKVKLTKVKIESELRERPWGLTDFRVVDPNGYYIRVTSKD